MFAGYLWPTEEKQEPLIDVATWPDVEPRREVYR